MSIAAARSTLSPHGATGEPCYGDTLRVLGPGPVIHLDTASAYDVNSGQLLRALTRQLFAYPAVADLSDPRRAFTVVADLAAQVPTPANGGISADGRTYTIQLRPDARWDTWPPRPTTAHDVVRGLKRLANPVAGAGAIGYFTSTVEGMREYCQEYAAIFAGVRPTAAALAHFQNTHDIVGARAVDDRTVVFRLCQPANDFLHILAMGCASAAPVEYDQYLPDSPQLRENMLSNGPYRVEWYVDGGREVRLTRNLAWDPQSDPVRGQFVDAIEIRASSRPADVIRQLLDWSEIDLAWSLPTVSWARTPPGRDVVRRSFPGYALNPYLVFNLRSPTAGGAVRDVRVRRAVAYAVDKVAVAEILSVLDVPTRPLHSAIPPGCVGHRDFNLYPTPGDRGDPATARALLVESGYGGGLRLVGAARRGGPHLAVLGSIATDLARIGVELAICGYDQAGYYGDLLSDPVKGAVEGWDVAVPGWAPDWFGNNGRAVVQPLFETNDAPGTVNYGGYSNPDVDRLIALALRESDPARAEELWHTIDRQVMTDVAVVPILAFAAMTSRFCSRRVRNVVYVPQTGFFDITNLWLEPAG
jgi:peptide/nickel transport system substrate-binding protein